MGGTTKRTLDCMEEMRVVLKAYDRVLNRMVKEGTSFPVMEELAACQKRGRKALMGIKP